MRIDSLRLIGLILFGGVVGINSVYSVASMVIAHWVFPHHAEGSRWVQEGRVESQWITLYSPSGAASTVTGRFPAATPPVWMHALEPAARSLNHTAVQLVDHTVNYYEDESFLEDEFLTSLNSGDPTLHWTLPIQPITINTLYRYNTPSLTPQWMLSFWQPTTPTPEWD